MPRTRSLAWTELKIGIAAVFAIVMSALLIFILGNTGGFFWQRYSLKAVFSDISGLKPGAPVRIAGVEMGAVTEVRFSGDRVEVVMEVSEEMQSRITDQSVATLGSVSLLGEAAVDITPRGAGQPVPEWGYVRTTPGSGSFSGVAAQASESLESMTDLVDSISGGQGTIGRLFTDEQLYVELNQFVTAAEQVARQITDGQGTLGRLIRNPDAATALESSLKNLEAVTAKLRAGEGGLGQLLNSDTLGRSLSSTTGNLDTLTGRLARGEGTAGRLLTDDTLFERLNSMSGRLDSLLETLQQGEGTAGQLLRDRQLYENMNGAVTELRDLVGDIRKDPRKYLNVRVSLF
ncbi:MAG: MCE family protein [Acidimicrobiia bacterium]|nr:MCE family protein [Acidimicrobiia bacterium]